MKRLLPLLSVLLVVKAAPARGQSLLAEADEGRGDLGEILRLSGGFWARLLGDRPEGSPFESLDERFRRYDVTPEIGGVVSGSGIGLGFTHRLWSDGRGSVRWSAVGTTEGYFQLAAFHEFAFDRRFFFSSLIPPRSPC